MRFDATLPPEPDLTPSVARALEAEGCDGLWMGELAHDPFLMALRAIDATERVAIGTSVAIAFARTPTTLANSAYDLARYSRGRFVLGLGSQIKAHIERRFSMPWSHPAARMREFVLALRAIWATWHEGTRLDYQGEFYSHTLMTPMFSPAPHQWGPPPVYLAGVGELMTAVAGEVGDGFFLHAFTTSRYVDEVTRPALLRGRAAAGRDGLDGFSVSGPSFVAIGRDEAELATAIAGTKKQIAFYASTPAYRPVLDLHGWGDVQPELTTLSKQGRWDDMTGLIDDTMLAAFAVVGSPADAGRAFAEKFGGFVDRATAYAPYKVDADVWPEFLAAARAASP
ncbi:LLM class F420-dependent oxidoreductase [Cryptosporangium aurantiacum]|uniref:Probable F420-dependent oxidoreductase, MSMEG_2256 family n=1 Tax=Cryptosporangium aurantiacum TaxID=134849 RepID=A0A1M7PI40_9ACTN|nr:LLM class F420-dependent oxidoreductase [Cryptosporangium aurantiacum]SHN16585.1 probable F420-dependent oxidoreductase, MSMEG_2256 family [Cryptosporangium aurantiacum]